MMLKWTWARFDDLGVHALHDALALRCKVCLLYTSDAADE